MMYVEKTLVQVELKYGYLPCKAIWKHLTIGKVKGIFNNHIHFEFCLLLTQVNSITKLGERLLLAEKVEYDS